MAKRSNHYDAAFEGFLRGTRTPHVVVDETRRALLRDASLKSMDFIVYSKAGRNLLVDVKGRRFPTGGPGGHKWENWATEDDLDSLLQWERVFGGDFRAMLVFAYHVVDPRCLGEFPRAFRFRDQLYAFYGVWADEFRGAMRGRSASWETVSLPAGAFHRLRTPIEEFL
ncbi:MAG: HYExAFE family protein [Planctomycetes bacterium]|nr:HYExAFE family protein [Planctomycetota bacterium]